MSLSGSASQSMPDLSTAHQRRFLQDDDDDDDDGNDLDPALAPPSRSPSPEHDPLCTPNPTRLFPAKSSPQTRDWHDGGDDDDDDDDGDDFYEEAAEDSSTAPRHEVPGGPGTYALHHPERARSDCSIHSAPELDRAGLMIDDSSFVEPESNGAAHDRSHLVSSRAQRQYGSFQRLPYTLWDYLQQEVLAVEMDGEEGVKSERVTNFLTVPGALEKIILFGVIICLDSFLYTFTILPLRTITALYHLLANGAHNLIYRSARRRHLRLSHKCDLTKAVILAGALALLHRITDASKMYHSVRGQDTIKLYVLFNVLEIADRLCCSFGQDLQDSLFSRATLGRRTDGSHPHIRPVALFGLNLAYVVAHTLVLFYQLVTLNVVFCSYSNALLTLLLSNQFVEIKSSVFKKFEKENLFQLTCADIVERFQLGIMLFIIALRNLIELSSASSSSLFSFLPASLSLSFTLPALPTFSLLQVIFSPAIVVLMSECFVDWLKHAFITKFNHIRPAVYGRFIDVLCRDLIVGSGGGHKSEPFVDQSPIVSRRLGFAALPLGCLVVRVISQALAMLTDDSTVDECAPRRDVRMFSEEWMSSAGGWAVLVLVACIGWACLVVFKLLIGINLRAFALQRWASMAEREQEDRLNDRKRAKIGVTAVETSLDQEVTQLLRNEKFDAEDRTAKVWPHVGRYDLVKSRLW